MSWSDSTTWETVCRRAAGRRRYNAHPAFKAMLRRAHVARLWRECERLRGAGATIAGVLGVSEATVSRDLAIIRRGTLRPLDADEQAFQELGEAMMDEAFERACGLRSKARQ